MHIYSMKVIIFENEVHLIWVIWTNGLQECKGQPRVRAQTLVFLVLALPATLMSATLIGGIYRHPVKVPNVR